MLRRDSKLVTIAKALSTIPDMTRFLGNASAIAVLTPQGQRSYSSPLPAIRHGAGQSTAAPDVAGVADRSLEPISQAHVADRVLYISMIGMSSVCADVAASVIYMRIRGFVC